MYELWAREKQQIDFMYIKPIYDENLIDTEVNNLPKEIYDAAIIFNLKTKQCEYRYPSEKSQQKTLTKNINKSL